MGYEYFSVIVYYDFLLTLGEEIQFAWHEPRTVWSWLFFFNRYFTLLSVRISGLTSVEEDF